MRLTKTSAPQYKVSILIPVYNMQSYLRECMESVLNQSLREIEIVCIDDGSTDLSGEMLDEYSARDERVRVIHKENEGYGKAINVGLRAATGEYVGIVEPDDYIERDMYETLWRAAKKYDLDIAKSDYSYFLGPAESRKFDRVFICPNILWYRKVLHPLKMPRLLDADMMNVTGIYRRAMLQENRIQLRETPGALYQDTGLWGQIFMCAASCMFIPKAFYKIRRDNPGSSVFNKEKLIAICDEYECLFQWLRTFPSKNDLFSPYLFRRMAFAYQFVYEGSDDVRKQMLIARFSNELKNARARGDWRKSLFSTAMHSFLLKVEQWEPGHDLPIYTKSRYPWVRLFDCLKEHGLNYTLKRVLAKLKIQNIINS